MAEAASGSKAQCVSCRENVAVPEQYAHGDYITCGACGTKHKVARGEKVRLVIADVTPLRDSLAQNDRTQARLKSDRSRVERSFGIGVNGIVIGVGFVLYQVLLKGAPVNGNLIGNAIGVAVVCGLLLEAVNWAFLGKRQRITRLSEELDELEVEARVLRQKIRDASRL
jgi:predicted RNA-binding Zn-ribbon protein involved in translation (DUF1610 family)